MPTDSATLASWLDDRSRRLTPDHRLGQIIGVRQDFEQAEAAFANGDLDDARATYELVVDRVDALAEAATRPCQVLAARAMARIAVIGRDRGAARKAHERFRALDAWPGLGGAELGDWAEARALVDPNGSEMLYQRAVISGSAPPRAVHHVAAALLEQGDTCGALGVIEPLAAVPTGMPAVDTNTHQIYADALRALERPADAAWSYRHAGRLLAGIGDPSNALELLRRAAELQPDDPVTTTVLAEMLADDGQTEAAVELLRQVVSRSDVAENDRGRAAQALAHILVDSEQSDVADSFVEDVREDLGSVWKATLRGLVAAAAGKIVDAIAAYTESVELSHEASDPTIAADTEERVVALAQLHLQSNDPVEALNVLDHFGEASARSAEFFRVLATARGRCGDATGAVLGFARATELAPDDGTIWSERAAAEHHAGRLDAAADHYRRALQLANDVDVPTIAASLGPLLVELERIEEAVDIANELAARGDDDGNVAALDIVNHVLAHHSDPTLSASRARFLLLLDEQLDVALDDLREILDPTGSPPDVVADAIEAMLRSGQTADADHMLRDAIASDVPLARMLELASELRRWGRVDELDRVLVAADAGAHLADGHDRAALLVLHAERDDELGRADAAEDKLEQATEAAPDDAVIWKRYGTWLLQRERPRDAIGPLRQAHQLDRDDLDVISALALAYVDCGEYAEAITIVDEAVRDRPDDGLRLHLRARVLLLTNKPDEALGDLEAMASIDRGRQWHADHGRALELTGRDEDAADAYRAALARDEGRGDTELHLALARVLNRLDAYDEAIEVLTDVSQVTDLAELDSTFGVAYQGLDRVSEAEDAYRRALDEAPDAVWVRVALANLLSRSDRHADAIALLDEWAGEASATSEELVDIAQAWWSAGDRDRALELLDRVSLTHPEHPPAGVSYLRGAILAESGRYFEAEELVAQEAAIDPSDAQTRLLLADLRLAIGRVQSALDALDGIDGELSIDAKRIEVLYQLGRDGDAYDETMAMLARDEGRPRVELIAECLTSVVRAERLEVGIELFERAYEGVPGTTADLQRLVQPMSDILIAAGGFEPALALLDELDVRTVNVDVDSAIAWVCSTLGGRHAARGVDAARRALRQSPDDPWLRKAVAEALEAAGDHENAAVEFKKVLHLLPDAPTSATADMMSLKGWCEYRLGRFDYSMHSLMRACRARHGRPNSEHFDLSLVLLCAGHTARAKAEYAAASATAGARHDALRARGLREVARIDLAEALAAASIPDVESGSVEQITGMLAGSIADSAEVFDRLQGCVRELQERRSRT